MLNFKLLEALCEIISHVREMPCTSFEELSTEVEDLDPWRFRE
jgi:hypothetical protein